MVSCGIEVDIEARAFVESQVLYQGSAECCLRLSVRIQLHPVDSDPHTLPAPAGPITRTPNLLMTALKRLQARIADIKNGIEAISSLRRLS